MSDSHTIKIKDLDSAPAEHLEYRKSTRINPRYFAIVDQILSVTSGTTGDYAILYDTKKDMVSSDWLHGGYDDSNGQVICIIVRGGVARTVFYRRITQDLSKKFFNVDKVVRINF